MRYSNEKIGDTARIDLIVSRLGGDESLENAVSHCHAGRKPLVTLSCRSCVSGKRELQVVHNQGLEALRIGIDIELKRLSPSWARSPRMLGNSQLGSSQVEGLHPRYH